MPHGQVCRAAIQCERRSYPGIHWRREMTALNFTNKIINLCNSSELSTNEIINSLSVAIGAVIRASRKSNRENLTKSELEALLLHAASISRATALNKSTTLYN